MTLLVATTVKALALGVVLGALWDAVRVIRVAFGVFEYSGGSKQYALYRRGVKNYFASKRGRVFSAVFVAVTDVIYFSAASVVFILFLYVFNYGKFRWFILLSCIAGFLAYYHSIGRAVMLISSRIADLVKLTVNIIIFVILLPVRAVVRVSVRTYRKMICPVTERAKSSLDKCRNKRYTLRCIKKLPEFVKFQGQ